MKLIFTVEVPDAVVPKVIAALSWKFGRPVDPATGEDRDMTPAEAKAAIGGNIVLQSLKVVYHQHQDWLAKQAEINNRQDIDLSVG